MGCEMLVNTSMLQHYYEGYTLVAQALTSVGGVCVLDVPVGNTVQRKMVFVDKEGDVFEQSAINLNNPNLLPYHYQRVMLLGLACTPWLGNILLLGVGGGSLHTHLVGLLPKANILGVEIDPTIIKLGSRYFGLDSSKVVCEDANVFLRKHVGTYDVIFVDIYGSEGVAPMGDDFWANCHKRLEPGGAVVVNWADYKIYPPSVPEGFVEVGAFSHRLEVDNLCQVIKPVTPVAYTPALGRSWLKTFDACRKPTYPLASILKACIKRDYGW